MCVMIMWVWKVAESNSNDIMKIVIIWKLMKRREVVCNVKIIMKRK